MVSETLDGGSIKKPVLRQVADDMQWLYIITPCRGAGRQREMKHEDESTKHKESAMVVISQGTVVPRDCHGVCILPIHLKIQFSLDFTVQRMSKLSCVATSNTTIGPNHNLKSMSSFSFS